jgi:hypothetical protein
MIQISHFVGEALLDLPIEGLDLLSQRALTDAADCSAVKLFLSGARRIHPDLEPAPADLIEIARICHLVGGAPLGILLATSWIETLTPAEIAATYRQKALLEVSGSAACEPSLSIRGGCSRRRNKRLLKNPRRRTVLGEIGQAFDNARTTWDWAVKRRHAEQLSSCTGKWEHLPRSPGCMQFCPR